MFGVPDHLSIWMPSILVTAIALYLLLEAQRQSEYRTLLQVPINYIGPLAFLYVRLAQRAKERKDLELGVI